MSRETDGPVSASHSKIALGTQSRACYVIRRRRIRQPHYIAVMQRGEYLACAMQCSPSADTAEPPLMSAAIRIRLLVVAALWCHTPLSAQPVSIWSLERGDRIRVVPMDPRGAIGTPTIGLFHALSPDTIQVALENGGSTRFALRDVSRLNISRGRTRATKYGVGVGLTIGVLVGLATGEPRNNNQGPCDANTEPRCGLRIGPISVGPEAVTATVAGLAIGGIVGSLIKYEAWNDVQFSVSPQGFMFTLTTESSAGNRARKKSFPSRNMRR